MAHIFPVTYMGESVVPAPEAQLSIGSSAVLYGLSVYTVMPIVRMGKGYGVFRLADHFRRLVSSARIIGIDTFEPEWTLDRFRETVSKIVRENALSENAFLRATVHVCDLVPGTRSRGLASTVSMFLYDAVPIVPQDGARVKTSVWRRIPDFSIPSRAKVNGAYVNSVLAKQDALDSGYDDCVFLDREGHVCELSAANIFIVRDGVLCTPGSSSDILEGITRRTVFELARELQVSVVERTVDLTELYIADEVFASGTSSFIAPIVEVDKRTISKGMPGPITKQLRERYLGILSGSDPLSKRYLEQCRP